MGVPRRRTVKVNKYLFIYNVYLFIIFIYLFSIYKGWEGGSTEEGEDTCVSYEEEDTCVSYEEEEQRRTVKVNGSHFQFITLG